MKVLRILLLATLLALFGLPILLLTIQAGAPGWRYPELLPTMSLDSARFVVTNPKPILASLASSLLYSLGVVLLSILMTILPARVLAFNAFRGKMLLEGFLLTPALIPAMTFSMGLHILFIRLGLADTVWGVILILSMTSYPYMLRALQNAYALMGQEYRICAINLGASAWRAFFQVELPLLFPAMAAGGSVVFLVAFSEYFLVFLIGGGNVASFTGYLFPLITSSNRGLGALVTLCFLIVPVALFALLETAMYLYYRKRGMR